MTPKERAAMQQALDMMEFVVKYPRAVTNDAALREAITALRKALAEQAEQEPVVDPYNGDDGHPFDREFHAQLLAGAHLLNADGQETFNMGWNAAKEFFTAPQPVKQGPANWVKHNHLTDTYDTPDGTKVPSELADNVACVADVLHIASIRESQRAEQEHREPTHDEYLELAKNADIVVAHEYCHLNEQEMKKAWVVEYGSQVYAKAFLDGFESAQQTEQEPVAWRVRGYNQFKTGNPAPWRYVDGADKPTVNKPDCCDFEPLYAAPVRTKDLTDDEIRNVWFNCEAEGEIDCCRAVIAADRSKNK